MVKYMMVNGIKVNNMEKEYTSILKEKQEKVYGKTERERNG